MCQSEKKHNKLYQIKWFYIAATRQEKIHVSVSTTVTDIICHHWKVLQKYIAESFSMRTLCVMTDHQTKIQNINLKYIFNKERKNLRKR